MRKLTPIATLAPWLRLLARRPGRLYLGVLLLALTALSAIGLLALSGWFITAAALTGMALAVGIAASLDVYVPGGGIRFFALSRTVARYMERLYNHDTVLRLLADLRRRLFAALANQDERTLAQRRSSDWLNRLTADIDALDSLYLRLLAPPAVALLVIVVLCGFLALWLPQAGLALLVLLMPAWLWLTAGQAWLGMASSRRHANHLERLRSHTIEHLTNMAELEAYSTQVWHRQRLRAQEAMLAEDQRRTGRLASLGTALANLVVGVAMVVVLWFAALAWQQQMISGPILVMMPLAVLALSEVLTLLPLPFTRFGATCAAAVRLNDVEQQAGCAVTGTQQQVLGDAALAIRLVDVGLRYPGALTLALDSVTLDLAPGARLALCGVSGAGKSSVAALLARRISASQGKVLIDGLPVEQIQERSLRERVALLGQRIDLFQDSLGGNLRLAEPEASDARLWQALEWAELKEWAVGLPAGLETPVGEGGSQLSSGQARRVALARLWLRNPGLVILDEPFAGLDSATLVRLKPKLDSWLGGRSVIYLVHQLDGGIFDPPGVSLVGRLVGGRLQDCARPEYLSG